LAAVVASWACASSRANSIIEASALGTLLAQPRVGCGTARSVIIPIASPNVISFELPPARVVGELWQLEEKMKHYNSIRYAYVWCEQLVSWDPEMAPDTPMETQYEEYVASARHLDHVVEKFQPTKDVISPVDFDTWYKIFCRVFEKYGYSREFERLMSQGPYQH
jgi:hypothetical protein